MTGYVELHVRGDCRVFLGAGDFAGVMTPAALSATDKAGPDNTISVLLKSGSTIDGIFGISASKLLAYMEGVKLVMKEFNLPWRVVFIDERENFEADLQAAISTRAGNG